ncbi:MAG TPA: prephenate dehydrogenase/arogenate dehydrogenase family protein [Solirubrobacterales bacterium]
MKVAVLGVGLIGGSVGLAARRRLEAEVAGFDPEPANLERGLELGALDAAAGSVGEACAGADVVFCAAPVGALPALAAEALAASGPEAVVTDVGSTKRELVAELSAGPRGDRFIGGHPLAGAETSGVENARAELFEGARWYLTPTEGSSGVHYDRLQRAIGDLGARPQAIDAATHDRVMATVSHLPHVLADVLVSQAADSLADGGERMPEIGPSFRDTTRVAGANPAMWRDILVANRDAVADEIDAVVVRLTEAAGLLRSADPAAIESWHRGAREDRRRLLDAGVAGGPVTELRIVVDNRPGTVAEIALALGRAAVNIEDMALYPASDMSSGAVSLWIAGAQEAERAVGIVRGLGHAVTLATES